MNTISIDFGTSFTSAAWINPKTGIVEPIRFIDNGKEKIPSLIYYSTTGDIFVGEAAQAPLTQLENFTSKQRSEIQASIVYGLKRKMNPDGMYAFKGHSPVPHAEILSILFKKVRTEAEVNCFEGKTVEKVVLTHPVVISQANKGLLKKAAELAGFKTIELLEDPVAAAMGYTHNGNDIGNGVLVYDFGGGTFDIAFVFRQGKGNFHVPIPIDGEPRCGGDDIDLALYDHWETLVKKKYHRPIREENHHVDLGFLGHCKTQKEALSEAIQKKFSLTLPPPKSRQVTRTLDRHTLEQLMRPIIDKTIQKTQAMLKHIKSAGLKLDTVILVGGSSRIPLVMERLVNILPIKPLQPMKADVAVCIGALLATKAAPAKMFDHLSPKSMPQKRPATTILKNLPKGFTPAPGDIWQEPLTGMKLVWVPPGSFRMGSPPTEKEREEDEGPLRIVNLEGFWMGQHPVTQKEWRTLMSGNPSRFKNGDNYPVEYVSWKDAQNFIKKINKRHDGKFRFGLPLEAQWEYACRAGTTTPFYFGENLTTDQANYNGHLPYGDGSLGVYREKTTPVGTFPPNDFGLYDMHGNVWEWCQDRYGGEYNPSGSASFGGSANSGGVSRVLRGGCWNDGAWICRSAYRNLSTPSSRHSYTGFRITMLPGQ